MMKMILTVISNLLRRTLAPKSRNKDEVWTLYYEMIRAVMMEQGWTW